MKICFISEAKSIHTQRWASSLGKAGCNIHLVSSSEADIQNVKIYHLPIYCHNPLQQIFNNYRVKRVFNEIKPDIFHLFGLFSMSSFGTMLLTRRLNNLIISVWGSDVVRTTNRESAKSLFIKKYLLNKADYLISTSNYLTLEIQKYLHRSIEIDTIPWGVDLDKFYPESKQHDQEILKLGFAKKLHKIYAPDIVLKAFKFASDRCNKKIILRIAGDGPMTSHLKNEAMKLGVANHIDWLGWLQTSNDLRKFYNSIDIFLMPSRRESFGVSAVEASASGLPVIASKFGGIPEIIINQENGLLVDPEDFEGLGKAIILLAENEELRLKMGAKGRKYVKEKFDWNLSVDKMLKIYEKFKKEKNN